MREKTRFKSADSTYCPKCKWWGQRHYHIRGTKTYEYFIHYGFFRRDGTFVISKLHHHYAWSCYIGKINEMRVRY